MKFGKIKARKERKMSDVKCTELVVNGVTYVVKGSETKEVEGDYVVVRTYSAGVFAGEIKSREGQDVVMKNVRRLWYWEGAASLSQLAMEGVKKPEKCKFPCEVTEITLTNAIEIIPCTKEAKKSIKEVLVWEM